MHFSKLEWEKFVVRRGNAFPFMNLLVTPGGHRKFFCGSFVEHKMICFSQVRISGFNRLAKAYISRCLRMVLAAV